MELLKGHGRIAGILLKGLVFAFFVTVILLMVLALIMLQLQPDLKTAETGILAIYVLASLIGGWYSGRKGGRRKFIWGLMTGVLYFLILLAVSMISDQTFQSGIGQSVTALLLCAAGGMIGGMSA